MLLPLGALLYLEDDTGKLRPLHDRLLVKRDEADDITDGGIIIPDDAKEKPVRGKVIAAGNGKVLEDGTVRPMSLKVSESVLFSKYGGTEIHLDGDPFLVINEDAVLAVMD